MNTILQARNISKQFANHKALDDVSLTVPEQSIFGLLGPNGAGKTTFIRIINQITGPDQGSILLNGEVLNQKHISSIGYLPEERGLYKKMKVGEQALYLAQLKGMSKSDATSKLKMWFEKFEIDGWWNRKVEELSKGMQQKIQFIVTVLHEPRLLIFDEPFSGFDPINVNLLKDEIIKLKNDGATIIFSTHNMESVEELCDHIALINQSKKILEGKVSEIREAHKSNRFEVHCKTDGHSLKSLLEPNYKIISEERDSMRTLAHIGLPSNCTANELLLMLVKKVQVESFKELLPSMNDIFIQNVNQDKKQETGHE